MAQPQLMPKAENKIRKPRLIFPRYMCPEPGITIAKMIAIPNLLGAGIGTVMIQV